VCRRPWLCQRGCRLENAGIASQIVEVAARIRPPEIYGIADLLYTV